MRSAEAKRAVPCAAGLCALALGLCAAAPAQPAPPPAPPSSIRVTGEAQVTAQPDRAQIDIGVATRAVRSQDAAAQNARAVDSVLAALRKAAGAASLKTISYSLTPTYQYHDNAEPPTLTGYDALNVVQVTLDDLAQIGSVIDAATRAGANRVQDIRFTLRDPRAVRAQALREAASRARADANVLAAALGLKVVRVLSVEENSPHIVPVRTFAAAARAASPGTPTPVEAGTLDVSAAVTLAVEVAPAGR